MNHTVQREAILNELKKSMEHLSADEIFVRLRRKIPQISLATIYRNLDLLAEKGLIKKVEVSGFQKRFESEIKSHLHQICPHCGLINNVNPPDFTELAEKISDFTAKSDCDGFTFNLIKCCPACKSTIYQKTFTPAPKKILSLTDRD